ncbi:hypothetical protein KFU94_51385 [Chloroflexi bacterium TSY]|nr:hypothetical protein [Chloroflexi bacterium TSY]
MFRLCGTHSSEDGLRICGSLGMSVVRDQNQDERRLSSEAYRNQSGFTTEDPNEPDTLFSLCNLADLL